MAIMFTMNADALNFVAPGVLEGMAGLELHFDLNIPAGYWLQLTGGARPLMLRVTRTTGYIRSDGRMYDTPAISPIPYDIADPGELGVRLLANDPALHLVEDVTYHVTGGGVLQGEQPWAFAPFDTGVPSVDTPVDLASFTPGPGGTGGGSTVAALGLIQAAKNPDLIVTGAVTLDGNDLMTSAAVVWPDGTVGTLTITSRDANGAVLAYNITYGSPVAKTYTQPAITRNANGAVTNVPAIVVT